MAYCGPRSIPYTEFLGGGEGWDDYSRSAALAWQRHESERCSGCGQHPTDLWAYDDDGEVVIGADGVPQMAYPPTLIAVGDFCSGCQELAHFRGTEAGKDPAVHARLIPASDTHANRPG